MTKALRSRKINGQRMGAEFSQEGILTKMLLKKCLFQIKEMEIKKVMNYFMAIKLIQV